MTDIPRPSELILFVTSRCHLRCRHCFNWRNLQRNQDLSLDEMESLARSLPNLTNLMISGGEPFLRKDIVDICRVFAGHSRVRSIDIPTSGSLVDRTVAAVEEILKLKPAFDLAIGISIDGMEEYHDWNRGASGTFATAVECCRRLVALKRKSGRLSVNVLTTLDGNNRDELLAVKNFVAGNLPEIDNLYWGIARGDTREKDSGLVRPDDLALVDEQFLQFHTERKGRRGRGLLNGFYRLRREAFLGKKQPVPCVAGSKIAVVYDDGGVAPCELLPPVGNLREMRFEAIWASDAMQEARRKIAAGQCACTHECFLYPSYRSFLLRKPLTFINLGGVDGLVQILYARCGGNAVVRMIGTIARKLCRGIERT